MRIYRDKDIRGLKRLNYELGLHIGYRLGYKMGQVDKNNKKIVNESLLKSPLSADILRELNDAGNKL